MHDRLLIRLSPMETKLELKVWSVAAICPVAWVATQRMVRVTTPSRSKRFIAHSMLRVTLLDTAEAYGPHTNEELVGKAIRGRREQVIRDEVRLSTSDGGQRGRHARNAKRAVEGSLKRLGCRGNPPLPLSLAAPRNPIKRVSVRMKELVGGREGALSRPVGESGQRLWCVECTKGIRSALCRGIPL